MFSPLIILLSLLCPFITQTNGNSGEISGAIEDSARSVCLADGVNDQIEVPNIRRISTIIQLTTFLESLSLDDELAECYKHLQCFQELREILMANWENVCHPNKIDLIENFHWKYILPDQTSILEPILPSLAIFFANYAHQALIICKRSLLNNLEWDVAPLISAEDNKFMDQSIAACPFEEVSESQCEPLCREFALVWDLVARRAKLPDDVKKLQFEIKSVKFVDELQQKCRNNFKPYYEKLITPIKRLTKLGYSTRNSSELFERELIEMRGSKLAQRWLSITQLCDVILPMEFFQDESLANEDLVLISDEEAAKLRDKYSSVAQQMSEDAVKAYEPKTNSVFGRDEFWADEFEFSAIAD